VNAFNRAGEEKLANKEKTGGKKKMPKMTKLQKRAFKHKRQRAEY